VGGAGHKRVAACTVHTDLFVLRVDCCLHDPEKPFCGELLF
jgi:hypothetical protein